MNRFITPARRWPAGWTRLHVYVLPDLEADEDLAGLADRCWNVLAEVPFVAAVPTDWLHVTVQQITGRPAADIGTPERDRLVDRLTAVLADLPRFTLTVGSALAGAFGVVADVDGDLPGQPFHEVYTRVRTAIGDVLGPEAVQSNTLPPHMTLAYGTGPGDSAELQSALRYQVRPGHATMTVRRVHLLDVTQNAETSEYRWTPVAVVPLGTATRSSGGPATSARATPDS